jgi:DNA repair ATPase RecN
MPDLLEESAFNTEAPEDKQLCEDASVTCDLLDGVRRALEIIASMADRVFSEWGNRKDGSAWKNKVDSSMHAYKSLQQKLSQVGAGDPAAYGEFVQHRQTIEQRLKDLEDRKKQVIDLRTQAETSLGRLLEIRRKITESRKIFLDKVLSENQYVRIQVVPYGAKETVKDEFRALLQREGGGFEKDIGEPDGEGLLGKIYRKGFAAEAIEQSLSEIKGRLRKIALNQHDPLEMADQRFMKHIAKLKPESLDRIDLWFPEDSLDVQYSTSGNRQSFRPIQEGSPGQKTAALLAFLLSYGEEPLILDQPEDDLDNHLIYDLIVMQLREIKRRRQIIVVTHNANIVVNGDAELVVALTVRSGQDKIVRNMICSVMEGGRKAFEQRYRRIALEGRHV